jgi:hypothetical protein
VCGTLYRPPCTEPAPLIDCSLHCTVRGQAHTNTCHSTSVIASTLHVLRYHRNHGWQATCNWSGNWYAQLQHCCSSTAVHNMEAHTHSSALFRKANARSPKRWICGHTMAPAKERAGYYMSYVHRVQFPSPTTVRGAKHLFDALHCAPYPLHSTPNPLHPLMACNGSGTAWRRGTASRTRLRHTGQSRGPQ